MRPLKDVSKEENFRPQVIGPGMVTTMRTPVEPEPVGSIVLVPFRVTGYEVDDNGNCKARLEQVNAKGDTNGWKPEARWLQSQDALVVEQDELQELFQSLKD